MTDEQINRVIAESLGWYQKAYTEGLRWIDPQCTQQLIDPPNFLTDPAMTLSLMKQDGFIEIALVEGEYIAEFCGSAAHSPAGCTHESFGQAINKELSRAMALAYIRAHNLTADRLEG